MSRGYCYVLICCLILENCPRYSVRVLVVVASGVCEDTRINKLELVCLVVDRYSYSEYIYACIAVKYRRVAKLCERIVYTLAVITVCYGIFTEGTVINTVCKRVDCAVLIKKDVPTKVNLLKRENVGSILYESIVEYLVTLERKEEVIVLMVNVFVAVVILNAEIIL